jgi:hypothetical protein
MFIKIFIYLNIVLENINWTYCIIIDVIHSQRVIKKCNFESNFSKNEINGIKSYLEFFLLTLLLLLLTCINF